MNPIIKLSDNAADRIKEIMSNAEKNALGVRVSVKSGGCAGMSYVMEYSKEINPNDEIIEDRMQAARDEMAHYNEADFIVLKDEFETALHDLQSIVRAHRLSQEIQSRELTGVIADLLR